MSLSSPIVLFLRGGILHCKPWSLEHRSIVEKACSGSRNFKHTSIDYRWGNGYLLIAAGIERINCNERCFFP